MITIKTQMRLAYSLLIPDLKLNTVVLNYVVSVYKNDQNSDYVGSLKTNIQLLTIYIF